jgi:hypothetical protein
MTALLGKPAFLGLHLFVEFRIFTQRQLFSSLDTMIRTQLYLIFCFCLSFQIWCDAEAFVYKHYPGSFRSPCLLLLFCAKWWWLQTACQEKKIGESTGKWDLWGHFIGPPRVLHRPFWPGTAPALRHPNPCGSRTKGGHLGGKNYHYFILPRIASNPHPLPIICL